MDHDFRDAKPCEIEFKESIFRNRYSEVFLVQIRGTICVMKVVSHCYQSHLPPKTLTDPLHSTETTVLHLSLWNVKRIFMFAR